MCRSFGVDGGRRNGSKCRPVDRLPTAVVAQKGLTTSRHNIPWSTSMQVSTR